MGLRQSLVWPIERLLHDLELLEAVVAAKGSEAFDRDLAAACDKLDELSSLAVVEFFQDFPEPLDDWRLRVIILVDRVLFQVFNVDGWKATDQKLELLVVEDLDQVAWNEIMESLQEGVHLRLDAVVQPVL